MRSRDTEVSFLKNKLRDVEQSFASLREKQKDLEQEYIVVKSKYSKLEAHYESVHEQKVFWICMCCFQYERRVYRIYKLEPKADLYSNVVPTICQQDVLALLVPSLLISC